MENFTFYSPTKFVFGKGTESQAGQLVKAFGGTKVLIHYGGGSVVRSGLLQRVTDTLDAGMTAFIGAAVAGILGGGLFFGVKRRR